MIDALIHFIKKKNSNTSFLIIHLSAIETLALEKLS